MLDRTRCGGHVMAGLSINEMTTYRWSFDEDVARYQAAGIGAIGVWRQKLADYGEQRGIDLLASSGLKVSNLLWAGGFTGSDGHSHLESLADAREALHLAAALGTSHLVIYTGPHHLHTQQHARRLFFDALDSLLPLAEQLKIVLDVEPMHAGCAEDWTFLTTLDEAVSCSTNSRARFSSWPSIPTTWVMPPTSSPRSIASRTAPASSTWAMARRPPIASRTVTAWGTESCRWRASSRRFDRAGYDGYYDVELIGEEIERCDYRGLLAGAKQTYERLALA